MRESWKVENHVSIHYKIQMRSVRRMASAYHLSMVAFNEASVAVFVDALVVGRETRTGHTENGEAWLYDEADERMEESAVSVVVSMSLPASS